MKAVGRGLVRRALGGLCTVGAAALLLAACGGGGSSASSSTSSAGPKVKGGTVTWAESSGTTPNYIFPLTTGATNLVVNSQFTGLMYRGLIYGGYKGRDLIDKRKSLYQSIVYSNGDKTVTITLKDWKWSNGDPITTRDVQFFFNLVKANKSSWSQYSSGLFPDNVKSFTIKNEHTFVLQLTQPYNPSYYTGNQLATIIPLPQKVWDKTSASGKVGNYDMTTAGAKKVWAFLSKEGGQLSTFDSNPLWKVVDGPWKLQSFQANGHAVFVPNKAYSGPDKPVISQFQMLPFTTDTAEFNVLKAGQVDVGYVPSNDLKQLPALRSQGYKVVSSYPLHIDFIVPNLPNVQVGPMLSQLYIRQAMQELIPQQVIVKKAYGGYAVIGAGPVPLEPPNPYISPLEKSGGPYPYSPSKAKALLTSHGWTVSPQGVDTCAKPGTGAGQCGKGITKGEKLEFTLLYASGGASADLEFQAVQSAMAQDGIKINLKGEPFNTVVSQASGPCNPKQPSSQNCKWQMVDWGGWVFGMDPVEPLLFASTPPNTGGYVSAKANSLIRAALHSGNPKAVFAYEDYIAKQLPLLWTPSGASLVVYKSTVHGVAPVNPFGTVNPEDWYLTKG